MFTAILRYALAFRIHGLAHRSLCLFYKIKNQTCSLCTAELYKQLVIFKNTREEHLSGVLKNYRVLI